ncbi:hypothetical protein [Bradyrhizobium sp. SZCCHNS3002]|uniref:hypothetical protein n=1 Tax=Bradyrhizobium sp. SZCCHNS3002 TaxID=3057310 RepID=UPI0028E82F0D|nr:hypothetical protein [Bradyrhizobium sp. SZCCHNS3002]
MIVTAGLLPDNIETLRRPGGANRADCIPLAAQAEVHNLEAELRARRLLIEQIILTTSQTQARTFGSSLERASGLDHLELEFADLEGHAAEHDGAAKMAAERAESEKTDVPPFERWRPPGRPQPEHLARERIVHPPLPCPCCSGDNLRKLGEGLTATPTRRKAAAVPPPSTH